MIKRIPFTGSYNTRPGTSTITSAVAVVGIGIVGIAVVGALAAGSTKDHRLINCQQITETDPTANSKRLYMVKRPGFAASITPASGVIGNAIHVWAGQGTGGKIMSAFGATNFTLYDSTTSKGSGTGRARGITETTASGTATLFIAGTDGTGWTYQDGGSVTSISDGDFPGSTVGNFAHLDGYPFIMTSNGSVWNGDLNSITAWTAASFIKASSVPDTGVGVVRNRNTIVAFCTTHFEVFRNAGNAAGSPLSRIEEYTQQIGCTSYDAIAQVRDVIYFMGTTKGSNLALYSYDGGKLSKVSTPEQETAFAISGPSNVSCTAGGWFGRNIVLVTAGARTYGYCIEENDWFEIAGPQNLWYKMDGVSVGATIVNYAVSKISTSGKVYVVNSASSAWTDDSSAYTAVIQTTKWDAGTIRRKTQHRLDVVADREVSTSNLGVAWYDDDYMTATAPVYVDLSTARPTITRCGSFRRRSYLLTHADNTPMRLEAIEGDFDVGVT